MPKLRLLLLCLHWQSPNRLHILQKWTTTFSWNLHQHLPSRLVRSLNHWHLHSMRHKLRDLLRLAVNPMQFLLHQLLPLLLPMRLDLPIQLLLLLLRLLPRLPLRLLRRHLHLDLYVVPIQLFSVYSLIMHELYDWVWGGGEYMCESLSDWAVYIGDDDKM